MDNTISIKAMILYGALTSILSILLTFIITSVTIWLLVKKFLNNNKTIIDTLRTLSANQGVANSRSQMLNEEKILSQILKNSSDNGSNSKKTKSK